MPAVIGAVTIGQSPRDDVPLPAPLVQAGALDDFTAAELAALRPSDGQDVLVTRLRDGTEQTLPTATALPLLQQAVDRVVAQQAVAIAVLCTETFDTLRSPVPLLYPGALTQRQVARSSPSRLAVIMPAPAHVELGERAWADYGTTVRVTAASPYAASDELERAARDLAAWHPDLIVLDCIGFSQSMQHQVEEATAAPVILPRTVLAQALAQAQAG